jgi:hypothetical protein
MEDRSSLLASGNLNSSQITEHILKFHDYDGLAADNDLKRLVIREQTNQKMQTIVPLWYGLAGFSAYNLSRLPVLTPAGKMLSISGFAVGSLGVFETLMGYPQRKKEIK